MPDSFEDVRYRKNFLREVIARVDFLSPIAVDESLPPTLASAAILAFPIAEPREALHRQLQLGPEVTGTEERFPEWYFHGRERTKSLAISRRWAWVRYTSYETFEPFKADFVKVIEEVRAAHPQVQVSRLGLRYVNVINLSQPAATDWSNYLASPILSLFEFPVPGDRPALSRVLHNLEMSFEEFNLRLLLGMHNPDFPARIRQKVFTLDFDAYTQSLADIRSVGNLLQDMHAKIQTYFELSIRDGLRGLMNED